MLRWRRRGGSIGFNLMDFRFMLPALGMLRRRRHLCFWRVVKGVSSIFHLGLPRLKTRGSSDSIAIGIALGISPFLVRLTCRYAFSDNAPSPMSAGAAIDVLQAAMPKANITEKNSPGWILVSHGVGGLYSRVLAARHTSQVKGL